MICAAAGSQAQRSSMCQPAELSGPRSGQKTVAKLAKKIKKTQKKQTLASLKKSRLQDMLRQARAHHDAGRWPHAEAAYRKVLDKEPDNDLALSLLARLMLEKPDFAAAEKLLRKAILLNPASSAYHSDLSYVLNHLQQWDASIAHCRRALQIDPDNALAYNNLGVALRATRRFDQAVTAFEQAIALRPDFDGPYSGICAILLAQDDLIALAAHLELMEQLFERTGDTGKMYLAFEMGKAFDRLDQYDKAFSYTALANRIKMQPYDYRIDRDLQYLASMVDIFDQDRLDRFSGCGCDDQTPIFIVGMPRSGTSLVEQILASHPDVHGGGELGFLPALLNPYEFRQMDCGDFAAVGRAYVQSLKGLSTAKHITDKRPLNFMYAGLIGIALPGARIIHCRRNPVDTCLSCFRQNFQGLYFCNNLDHLGRYYRRYEQVTQHWDAILPQQIFSIRYEDLVRRPEANIRKLLDFCGLPWNDACANFHRSQRIIHTASQDQVLKPIYDSSVARWKKYQHLLSPLLNALELS